MRRPFDACPEIHAERPQAWRTAVRRHKARQVNAQRDHDPLPSIGMIRASLFVPSVLGPHAGWRFSEVRTPFKKADGT
jgi:hypothetical protein